MSIHYMSINPEKHDTPFELIMILILDSNSTNTSLIVSLRGVLWAEPIMCKDRYGGRYGVGRFGMILEMEGM